VTFSIAGVCPSTGMVGAAIASSSICVASRCTYVRSSVGVALTQNVTNPDLGPLALDLMSDQISPPNILKALAIEDIDIQWRQIGVLNLAGEGTTFSGNRALGTFATAQGKNCIALGNLLDNSGVPEAMIKSFENRSGHLAERLLKALEAGLAAGGELGTVQSAGLLVAARPAWPVVDLRVDWHIEAISELRTVWRNYQPQMDTYIDRAKDPANAESYGVPGDA
jgi:uncharacterized Ntn-hydrolase superfamily protein